jgi:hypothetical protein
MKRTNSGVIQAICVVGIGVFLLGAIITVVYYLMPTTYIMQNPDGDFERTCTIYDSHLYGEPVGFDFSKGLLLLKFERRDRDDNQHSCSTGALIWITEKQSIAMEARKSEEAKKQQEIQARKNRIKRIMEERKP